MPTRIIDVDIEAIVIDWALTDTDLIPHFGDNPMRIAGELDPKDATFPAAVLSRISTTNPVPEHLYAPLLEVDVYAATKPAARDAAAALHGRMVDRGIVGTHAGRGVVTGFETAQGIRELDLSEGDIQKLRRFIFAVRYYTHPLPQ